MVVPCPLRYISVNPEKLLFQVTVPPSVRTNAPDPLIAPESWPDVTPPPYTINAILTRSNFDIVRVTGVEVRIHYASTI